MGEVYLSLRGGLYSTNYFNGISFLIIFYYNNSQDHIICDNDSYKVY